MDYNSHPIYDEFLSKKTNLPNKCKNCEYLNLCNGGCPRNRNWYQSNNSQSDYFCQSFKQIYQYADERMRIVARNVKARRIENYINAGQKLPSRNDTCLCGSGKKFKKCCEPLKQVNMNYSKTSWKLF
ncbi:SEC-C metal-binding domain-containing protein [Litchfieldia alkalitelluris]|uniref:SEC-C metal-binding domain-containing protein n=1 Tax=Litchfieldia alkalitelluris TaxID=304268 RepID=UPI002E25F6D1|nr:SEC-C metal-binding domain-containing protein [Litchfieldia alkalitelluris]